MSPRKNWNGLETVGLQRTRARDAMSQCLACQQRIDQKGRCKGAANREAFDRRHIHYLKASSRRLAILESWSAFLMNKSNRSRHRFCCCCFETPGTSREISFHGAFRANYLWWRMSFLSYSIVKGWLWYTYRASIVSETAFFDSITSTTKIAGISSLLSISFSPLTSSDHKNQTAIWLH